MTVAKAGGMTVGHVRRRMHRRRTRPNAVARPRRAAHRRRHRRRRAAAEAPARRAARSRSRARRAAPSATARWCGPSSRPCCAGSARCGICLARCSRRGLPQRCAAGRSASADRRRADPVSRRAGSCRGRSVGAAGAGRPHALALFRPGQRGAAPARARRHERRSPTLDTAQLDTPDWLLQRWIAHYGERRARAIAARQRARAGARSHGEGRCREQWARRLDGRVLPTGTVRIVAHGPVSQLAGLRRRRVVGAGRRRRAAGAAARRRARQDASPTSAPRPAARPRSSRQPARRSPRSTAREPRLQRLRENLARLQACTPRSSPPTPREWQAGPFDAVLLDAPCSSTGTIRRHPDIPWLKRETDLDRARRAASAGCSTAPSTLVKPGGTLVYCTCSLEPEEGEHADRGAAGAQSRACAAARSRRLRSAGIAELLTPTGDLRTLPCHLARSRTRGWAGSTASTRPGSTRVSDLAALAALAAVPRLRYMMPRGKAGRRAPATGQRRAHLMAGLSIAERAKLSVLLARRALRSARRPPARPSADPLELLPGKADRLLIAPQDLRTADGTRASEIYAGRFAFAGKVVICDGRSPFEIDAAVRGMGGEPARLRLAAPSARRRIRHHPRQCARAGRRMDHAAGLVASGRAGSRRSCRAASSPGSARRR